ncbi:hypothetical protein AAZV13_10G150900 [Glycine max]
MVKMSSESETIKPKTDFGLILNYSNKCIWKNDSGAGANAACRIDKTFSAIDPLSEIVWSPDKGFSLKCVDSSFTNKKTSLLGDVEPSSMVLALLQSVNGSSTTDKPIDDVSVEPIVVICSKSDVSSTDTPARNPASDSIVIIPDHKTCEDDHDIGFGDNMQKMTTERETPNLPNSQKENVMNDLEKNICAQANIGTAIISEIKGNKSTMSGQVDERLLSNLSLQGDEPKCRMEENPSPSKHCNGDIDTGIVNQVVEIEDGLYTMVEHTIECKGSSALGTNLISSGISPSQKLESTAENDLQTFNYEATCAATSTVLVSKFSKNKNKFHVNEKMLLCSKNHQVMPSPSNSRIQMTRNEGRKRSKMQQVIIGSKKFKKQTQETSCSKSYVKPDSSFMNLISNMIKGCSQSTQDGDKSLALNLENPNHHLQQLDQKLLKCNKNQDSELKNAGFRSNFQSMVGAKFKNVGTRMSQVGEASKDFEPGTKVHGIDATPITFYAENNSLYRQYLQSNKLEISEGRFDACPPIQPQTRPINSLNSHEHWKNNSMENENCYNLELTKEKEGMALLSLHSPSTRQNRNDNENAESCAMYESKGICHRSDNVEGLWINRFLPKSTSPLVVFDHLNERGGSEVHSASCAMLPNSNKHISLNNCKIEEAKEQSADDQLLSEAQNLHNCCVNKEDSTVLKDDKGNQYHTAKLHKFNSFTPFPGLRAAGPMVSMFARRLGAIKQFQHTE